LEVPALGGLLCAERTPEHLSMYEEGKEALFWDDPEECAVKCNDALKNPDARAAIAAAGHERIRANGDYNEQIMKSIIGRIRSGKENRRKLEYSAK
jgi:spore maturation protein CgeB